MYIAYFDETGDDGFPEYSSELFALTSIYLHCNEWKNAFFEIREFRKEMKRKYGFPIKLEMHTHKFLREKKPYTEYGWRLGTRKQIIKDFLHLIVRLDMRIINVVINKKNIKAESYEVLDRAFSYNIQRIENDLNKKCVDENMKFIIVTDEGRVGKMRKTSRRVQVINPIPSKYHDGCYRSEIQRLIEDPLPKQSSESYFIQIADFVSFFIYLYSLKKFNHSSWARRIENKLTFDEVCEYLETIKGRFNLDANRSNKFGIVHYPK